MLLSHRRSAYLDTEELELATGELMQDLNASNLEQEDAAYLYGAYCALHLLEVESFKDAHTLVLRIRKELDLMKGVQQ